MTEVSKNPHIILVDDEPGVLNALKLLLKAIGFTVSDFIDPHAALEAISSVDSTQRTVIVSDLRMPSLDGIQLVTKIREINSSVPFILMSAHATSDDISTAKSSGANGFLAKPFTPDQFREIIQNISFA